MKKLNTIEKVILITLTIIVITFLILVIKVALKYNPDGINVNEFEKIKSDMTMSEVDSIISSSSNPKSEHISTQDDTSSSIITYKYYGERSGYAIITYELDVWNNKGVIVISKTDYNLK